MRKVTLLLLITLAAPSAVFAEHRLVSVGDRRLSLECEGKATPSGTVVLISGGGRTAKDWAKVQPQVAKFARVCSYDEAGFGDSDKTDHRQSADEIVEDLHALLQASGEKGPYVLVGHSISGIHVRRFQTKFSSEVAALVLVDSSHEEQPLRLHAIDPQGPTPGESDAAMGFLIHPGQRLAWRTEVPVVVLGRGKPFPRDSGPLTEEQFAAWDRTWQEMQQDLAKRSPHARYVHATNSGHFIHLDQPELVIDAIREVYTAL